MIGGYLGAGKTTLLTSLLRDPGGRRIGVIINDFGELAIDASLIASTDGGEDGVGGGAAPVVNLANGCVCCTLGDDLRSTLIALLEVRPPLDHIVVEASGVADPAATAAWGTVAPFVPGGIIVLAAADAVQRMARDRYVGSEVRRQLAGADLIIVTKRDLVRDSEFDDLSRWLAEESPAPVVDAMMGALAPDIVLGASPLGNTPDATATPHAASSYTRWSWQSCGPVKADVLTSFLAEGVPGLLRLKGVLEVRNDDGTVQPRLVQVVGRSVSVTAVTGVAAAGLEAIGVAAVFDPMKLEASATRHLRHR